jgi:hypothetical protein
MKMKKPLAFLVALVLLQLSVSSQDIKYKVYKLRNFGVVSVPEDLDTVGQRIIKRMMLDELYANLAQQDKKTFQELFQVNIPSLLLHKKEQENSYIFLPAAGFKVFDSTYIANSLRNPAGFDRARYKATPTIRLSKTMGKLHSAGIKEFMTQDKDSASSFASFVEGQYVAMLKTAFPDFKLNKASSGYSFFQNKFPMVKVNVNYIGDGVNYIQEYNLIYKGYFNYALEFESLPAEEERTREYIKQFFLKLQLQ